MCSSFFGARRKIRAINRVFLSLEDVEHARSIYRPARAQRRPLSCKERQTAENSLFDHRRRRRLSAHRPQPTCLLEIVPEREEDEQRAGRQCDLRGREREGELDGSQVRISHLFSEWPPSTDRHSAATPPLLPQLQTIKRHCPTSYTTYELVHIYVQGRVGGDHVLHGDFFFR